MDDHHPTNRERKIEARRRRMRMSGRGLLTVTITYEPKLSKKAKKKVRK